MADYSTYDTTDSPSGPEKPRTFSLKLLNDLALQKRNHLGDTIAVAVPGMLKAYAVGNNVHFKVVLPDNSEAEALAGIYKLREDLNCDKKALKQFTAERVATASVLALDAANEGVVQEDSTQKRLTKGGTTKRHYLGQWSFDNEDYKRVACALTTAGLGSAATSGSKNGETGYLMDGGADELRVSSVKPIPAGWSGAADVFLELLVVLNQAEANGDSIDMQVDFKTALVYTGGFGGASSNVNTVSQPNITAGGADDGDYHRVLLALPRADATNPTTVDRMFQGVVKRNGLANVGGVIILAANLLCPSFAGLDHTTN